MEIQSSSQPLSSFLERTAPRVPSSPAVATRQTTAPAESYEATRESVEASQTSGARPSLAAQVPVFTPASGSASEQGVSTGGTSTTDPTTTTPAAVPDTSPQTSFAPSQSVNGEPDPSPAAPWFVNVVKQPSTPELGSQAKSALLNALVAGGVDPSKLKFSYWEEIMWFPGGCPTNKEITVQGPNGQKMDFGAAETLNDPATTAQSILKMFNV